MTIKLSTTNSAGKTLQHKALCDLETLYKEVGQSWLQLEGICSSVKEQALDSRDPQDFFFTSLQDQPR